MSFLRRARFLIRAIAGTLAVLMVLQDAGYAAPAGTFVSEAVSVSALPEKIMPRSKALAGIFAKLNLPEEIGKVDSTYWNSSKNTVIHIRDLHSDETAQRKIAQIIHLLSARYGVRMVQLEGASGELAHGLLSRYPDRKARVLMGRAYLNEGKITGPEYLAVTRDPNLILYGVENKEMYDQNRLALLNASELSEGLTPYLGEWRKVLERLAVRVFPPLMRQWMTEREGFKNHQRTIAEYVRFLKRMCAQEKLDCDTPQIKRLLKLEKLEDQARREERFKSEEEISKYLAETLKQEGGIDLGIFDEIKKIEKTLEIHWVTPPAGLSWDLMSPAAQSVAQLYKLFQILGIYEKMFDLALTRDDVEFLYQNREEFGASSLSAAVTGLGHHYGYEINPAVFEFEELTKALKAYEDFYTLALARDEQIVSASMESMKRYGQTIAVLVSGGFHTPAIEERLKKEGYNFCTITPALNEKIDFEKTHRLYLKAMEMSQSPMTQYAGLHDSALQLQIPSLFPTRAELDSLGPQVNLPEVLGSHELVGDLVTMMVALASTGLRKTPADQLAAGFDTAFKTLGLGERRLVPIYHGLNRPGTRVRHIDEVTGSAAVEFFTEAGFGLEINWKPAPFGSAAGENVLRQSFSFVTPDGVRSEVRVLTDPLLSEIAVRNFDRSLQRLRSSSRQGAAWTPQSPVLSSKKAALVQRAGAAAKTKPVVSPSSAEYKNLPQAKAFVKSKPELPAAQAAPKKAAVQPAAAAPVSSPAPVLGKINPLPELAALLFLAAAGGPLALLPLAAIVVRVIWFSGIFVHGFGHVLLKWIVDQDHPFVLAESMEGITAAEFRKGLVPFLSIYTPVLSGRIPEPVPTGDEDPLKVSVKALAGPVLNALSAAAAGFFLFSASLSGPVTFGLTAVLVLNSLFAALSWSDYAAGFSGAAPYGLACGYLDYVGPRLSADKKSLVPEEYVASITNSTRILSGRGTQAYGFQMMAMDRKGNAAFLGLKDVNPKRAVLHNRLRADLLREVQSARRDGFRPFDDLIEYSSHLRFGTSTPPSKKETHPHVSPEAAARHYDWSDSTQKITAKNKNFQVGVRHNGDNDGVRTEEQILKDHPIYAFGKEIDYNDIRIELSRILYEDTTKGDSPVLASMLALYNTQGRWDASARLAYLMMAGSLQESFAGQNDPASIDRVTQRWGSVFDAEFSRHKDRIFTAQNGKWVPDRAYLEQTFIPAVRQAAQQLRSDRYLASFSADVFESFIQSAVFAFLHQDTYRAIQMLMATSLSSSTFGLSVSSTLEPRMKFWVAKGQPGALGHNPDTGAFIAASDPGAVFGGLNQRSRFLTFNDDQGEVIRLDMKNPRAPKLNLYSQALHRELTQQEIEARWSSVAGNPYTTLPPIPEEGSSALKQDNADLNSVLARSHDGFDARHRLNPKVPSNRISADRFNQALWEINLQRNLSAVDEHETDILFIAEGPNYDLLNRKILDLKASAPGLRLQVVKGNEYMEHKDAYYSGVGSAFKIGKNTIVFSVSQSGMTFSNVDSIRDAEIMRKKGLLKDVFIMTGEWFSVLGSSLGQEYFPNSEFSGRIFSNMSGRRHSESATMAAATDFFLSELFIDTFKNIAAKSYGGGSSAKQPFGMKLTLPILQRLEANLGRFVNGEIEKITGVNAQGREVEAPAHHELLLQGQDIANNISEQFFATSMVRIYTFISTQLHLPIFRVLALIATFFIIIATGVESFAGVLENITMLETAMLFGIWFIAHEADSFFYTWQDKVFTYLIRFGQGRKVFARVGSRSLSIGGSHWSLLRDYFRAALLEAPAGLQLASIDGRETAGDFVHRFKDAARGSLVLILLADPKNATTAQNSSAGAWKMAISQLDGVRNFDVGPHLLAVTTNPALKSRYKAKTVVISGPEADAAADPVASDDIYRTLNVRWFEELKLLVSGYVIAAEMSEKLSKVEIPFYVRRTESFWAYAMEAIFSVPARMYSALVLRTYDSMMQIFFRAAPYERIFTPGHGQSGLTVFTTQINAPRPNKIGQETRSLAAIAKKLSQEGIDASMPWLPSAGVFSYIYADLYDPRVPLAPAQPAAALTMPLVALSEVHFAEPAAPQAAAGVPGPVKIASPARVALNYRWKRTVDVTASKGQGANGSQSQPVSLDLPPLAVRPSAVEPPHNGSAHPAAAKELVLSWGTLGEPDEEAAKSEVRNIAPGVELSADGKTLTLVLSAETGGWIQTAAGQPVPQLSFVLEGTVYKTADGGASAQLDVDNKKIVFAAAAYRFAFLGPNQQTPKTYKSLNLPVTLEMLERMKNALLPPRPEPAVVSPVVPQVVYEQQAPEPVRSPAGDSAGLPGIAKFLIAGLLITLGAVLAQYKGVTLSAPGKLALPPAPWAELGQGHDSLIYWGGLVGAGLIILWQTRDRSSRPSRMASSARLRGIFFRVLFLAAFPALGFAALQLNFAPLPVLSYGLWFFYGSVFAGAFVLIWGITVLSLPVRRWLPTAVTSWFSFKKDVQAVLGLGLLAGAAYIGVQYDFIPKRVLHDLNLDGISALSQENKKLSPEWITAPFSQVPWPASSQVSVPRPAAVPEISSSPAPASLKVTDAMQLESRPQGPLSLDFPQVTPLLYEPGSDAVSTVSLLAQREGYLELDPQSGITASDWQNPGKAFLLKGAHPLLRYRRPVTETQAAALRDLILKLKEVQARYEGQDPRVVPLRTQLLQKEAVLVELLKNYDAEQQEQIYGTLLAPLKKNETGWILPGKRALGTAASGTVLARFHSQNRLTLRVAMPLSAWKNYDFAAMNVRVSLQGQAAEARVVHMTLEPRLDGQLLVTLELLSEDKIFSWDVQAQGPASVDVRLDLPVKKEPVTYSAQFPSGDLTRSYAQADERVRFPVNPTGALGRTRFTRSEGEWVQAKELVGGVREEDRELLKAVLQWAGVFQTQVESYLQQLRNVRGSFSPAELTRFEPTLAQIKTLKGYLGIWDYEAPQTGILTGSLDSEGQAFHDRPIAEIITPQIFIRHRIEKRISVKTGDIVIIRRASSGEETLGIVRQVKRELTDQSRGEDQSRFQEISIEIHNEPSLWFADHEYGLQVFYTLQPSAQTQLQDFYRQREEQLHQEYARTTGGFFPARPVKFITPAVEGDQHLLIDLLERSSAAPAVNKQTAVFSGLSPELAHEQSGEITSGLKPFSNAEVNRILGEFNGDKRRQWMGLFLQNASIPAAEIEEIVLHGASDVSQMSLDYLLRQRRILDLMAIHQTLYRRNPDLDMTKLARAHIIELLESEEDPLKRLVQLDYADSKRALAEEFLASLLLSENSAYDADKAIAVRKVLASAFWRTHADKLAFADALETGKAADLLGERRRKAATLVRNIVFADIAVNVRWAQGEPQQHAKEAGAVQRYDTGTWDKLEVAKYTDEQDRLRLQLPWVVSADVSPEENFKDRINAVLFRKALEVYRGFQADAAAVKPASLTLMDFEPRSGSFYSDHVFNRLDALTLRNDYLQHLSLHALERLLEMSERPENTGYRERREQIIDRLIKENTPHSRLILARTLVKTSEPEVLQLLLTKDVGRLLIEELQRFEHDAVHVPGALLLYQQALAKLSGSVGENEGDKRLALRVLLDTLSDFELKELSQGNHPVQQMLESAGVPEAVIHSTAGELLRRHEMLWAMDTAAHWESAATLKSQVFIQGQAAFKNLSEALGHENFNPERVQLALAAAERDQPRLSHRMGEILEALDGQIDKGPEREVTGHLQTWRLSLAFILAAFGFVIGGGWGFFNLMSSKAYWPGKRSSRSEVREAPAAMLRAFSSKDQMLQNARLSQEFSFETYETRSQNEFGVNLETVFKEIPAAVRGLRSIEGQPAFSGEIILSYRAGSHAADFAQRVTSLMRDNPDVQRLTLIKSARASDAEWDLFKEAVRARSDYSQQRISFGDEQGYTSLEAVTQERLRSRGLSEQALVQILEPSEIREKDRRTYDQFLVKAAPLGRETILILGDHEPLQGAGLRLTVEEVLENTFQAYALVSSAA